jgi:hypothetical protein
MKNIALLFAFIVGILGQSCRVSAPDGSTYDLSRLAALGTIAASDSNGLWTYTVSICSDAVNCGTASRFPVGYCQYGRVGGTDYYTNVGYLDQIFARSGGAGVELLYYESRERKTGKVIITCDPNNLVSQLSAITPTNPSMPYEFRFSSVAGCASIPVCSTTTQTGLNYDLTDFIGIPPITASDDVGLWKYSVTVCDNDIDKCDICAPAGYCQTSNAGHTFCVGNYHGNITGREDGSGVDLIYTEPTQGRVGKVSINCDPNAGLVSGITAISPPTKDGYSFTFRSYTGCPTRPPCIATSADGSVYDLDELVLQPPLTGTDDDKKWKYTVSICQNQLHCGGVNETGYCQNSVPGSGWPEAEFCVGTYESISGIDGGKGVKLIYKAPADKGGRVGTVNIACNPNGPLVSDIKVVSPDHLEGYEFNFSSRAACSKK